MSGFLARHGAHVLVLGGPVVVLEAMFMMLEPTRPDRTRRSSSVVTCLLALTWAAVATTHLTIIKELFGDSAVLGTFFLVLSLGRYSYAVAVLPRASRRLLIVGMLANLSVVLLWTYTRVGRDPVRSRSPRARGHRRSRGDVARGRYRRLDIDRPSPPETRRCWLPCPTKPDLAAPSAMTDLCESAANPSSP